jgi:hypothetical protein
MPIPRPVARFAKAIPFLGDALAVGAELTNPAVRSPIQRGINAAVVGGGGMATSAVTGGLDAVPQLVQLVNEYTGGPVGPEKLRQLQACAPALNAEEHLRELSTRAGSGAGSGFYANRFAGSLAACGKGFTPTVRNTREAQDYGRLLGTSF